MIPQGHICDVPIHRKRTHCQHNAHKPIPYEPITCWWWSRPTDKAGQLLCYLKIEQNITYFYRETLTLKRSPLQAKAFPQVEIYAKMAACFSRSSFKLCRHVFLPCFSLPALNTRYPSTCNTTDTQAKQYSIFKNPTQTLIRPSTFSNSLTHKIIKWKLPEADNWRLRTATNRVNIEDKKRAVFTQAGDLKSLLPSARQVSNWRKGWHGALKNPICYTCTSSLLTSPLLHVTPCRHWQHTTGTTAVGENLIRHYLAPTANMTVYWSSSLSFLLSNRCNGNLCALYWAFYGAFSPCSQQVKWTDGSGLMPGTKDAATPELFQDEVPVLRTSLVRHGLVDLSISTPASRVPMEVRMQDRSFTCCVFGSTVSIELQAVQHNCTVYTVQYSSTIL